MAVIANQADSKLKLMLNAGLDEGGDSIIKSKTFKNVKTTVTNENLYSLATSLSGLQTYTLENVVRYEEYQLLNQI